MNDHVVTAAASLQQLLTQSHVRARMLRSIARNLNDARNLIIATCSQESALTSEELAPEFARMTRTLEMFADVVDDGRWTRAAISPKESDPTKAIGPNHDVRSMLIPLEGAAIVFGASNFPLAYGVCGGDTGSALAAGCPVVVKEHPAHPHTGKLIAQLAREAIANSGLNPDVLCYAEDDGKQTAAIAKSLIQHEHAAAVGFTGSVKVGLLLDSLARERPIPIPVFAEMGSTNPVFVTTAAAKSRGNQIGTMLADSILSRFGQQCTCPGLIFVSEADAALLREAMVARFAKAPSRDMLTTNVRDTYVRRLKECTALDRITTIAGGKHPGNERDASATLLETSLKHYESNPTLHEEIFGPAAILITTPAQSLPSHTSLKGTLTATVFGEVAPDEAKLETESALKAATAIAGRVIFNGVPTGVRVAPGMVHGGPLSSTNRPDTTAVGPMAIERWCRPVCFQNWTEQLLPSEVQNSEFPRMSR
ncbi:MAG: aldehyde dehydrogenase family protein [Phycisphaerales bacterium]